jgi:deoxyguanosine kinase
MANAVRQTFVAIEGPIGVGKTTLTELISNYVQEDVRLVHEDAKNPFLKEFYGDAPGSAFRTQLYFLLNRYEQLKDLRQRELFNKKVVSDFTFDKDKIFAYLTLADSELVIYEKLFDMLVAHLPKPDLVIYLTADVKTLKKRIVQRGREIEKNIDDQYLEEVNNAYNYYFYHYNLSPLLVINTEGIDFVNNRAHLDDLMAHIDEAQHGTRYYTPRR